MEGNRYLKEAMFLTWCSLSKSKHQTVILPISPLHAYSSFTYKEAPLPHSFDPSEDSSFTFLCDERLTDGVGTAQRVRPPVRRGSELGIEE